MYSEILRFTLLFSLLGLLLPSPAAAQRWNDLEDELEGRELVLRPTFEGRRKVYLDGEDDRVFVLHRGNRLFHFVKARRCELPTRTRKTTTSNSSSRVPVSAAAGSTSTARRRQRRTSSVGSTRCSR